MKVYATFLLLIISIVSYSQKQVELFNLVKAFIPDSSEYSAVGNWAVGKPTTYPVKWENDRVTMSDDMTINFYRKGTANISINRAPLLVSGKPMLWNVMIKGPRAGFSSFTIKSAPHKSFKPKAEIDSLLFNSNYTFKLLKACSKNENSGFYYYKLNIPGKEVYFLKASWTCNGSACSLTFDGYDDWSRKDAVLTCP